jgi:hypothetical protein
MALNYPLSFPDIHQGTGYLWYGVPLPADGALMLVDAYGNPVGGSPLAMDATEGPAVFHPDAKIEEVMVDQTTMGIGAIETGDSAFLEITLTSSALQRLIAAVPHGAYSSGTNLLLPPGAQSYEMITGGGLVVIPTVPISFISPRKEATIPKKFLVVTLYNAYTKNGVPFNITKVKFSSFKVRFDALAITTRTPGNQGWQVYRQL